MLRLPYLSLVLLAGGTFSTGAFRRRLIVSCWTSSAVRSLPWSSVTSKPPPLTSKPRRNLSIASVSATLVSSFSRPVSRIAA